MKKKSRRPPRTSRADPRAATGRPRSADARLRIIGGQFRRRLLDYHGDPRTRPMKDRVREAVFNVLGSSIAGTHAIDLFAGTGALGLEALSRGAARATFFECYAPAADSIRKNIESLGVSQVAQVINADSFAWFRAPFDLGAGPWGVFCSPPYDFYVERLDEMLGLIATLVERAPRRSVFVVEADARFDFGRLPRAGQWRVRTYAPAIIGFLEV